MNFCNNADPGMAEMEDARKRPAGLQESDLLMIADFCFLFKVLMCYNKN